VSGAPDADVLMSSQASEYASFVTLECYTRSI
jgi:hypothetical protein